LLFCFSPSSSDPDRMCASLSLSLSLQYSGAEGGLKIGMVLCLEATSIDRGACIRELSQYPGEVEYLFVPCSFVEPTGVRRLEASLDGGLVWTIGVRVNANLKSLTVEELEGRKKKMHLAAFDYLLVETERALKAAAGKEESLARLKQDV